MGCHTVLHAMELVETGQANLVPYDTGYIARQLAAGPLDAAHMSLGCGKPTAIASRKPGETVLDIGRGAGIDVFCAARCVGSEGHVIGSDMMPSMIERARRNAEGRAQARGVSAGPRGSGA